MLELNSESAIYTWYQLDCFRLPAATGFMLPVTARGSPMTQRERSQPTSELSQADQTACLAADEPFRAAHRVVDNLPEIIPVNAKELAAIEMFLGTIINVLIAK